MPPARPLRFDRAHDYAYLIRRWRRAASQAGLRLHVFAEASQFPIFVVETRRPRPGAPWLYLSAGIHGDEPGGTEGLLNWAENDLPSRPPINLLLFPCLNPWGLVNNSRYDAQQRDLNRTYHDATVAQTAAHVALLAGHRFDAAITLHEDYDARGIYLYEVRTRRPHWGEIMLRAAASHIPIESRSRIEGRPCRNGLVRRTINPELMPLFPEAFVLHFHHSTRTFTTETPSEYSLDARVAAQVAIIRRAAKLCVDAS
jgi:protein MpaA